MKSCKKGYYYCNTEKKCMPIPDGHTVRDDGFLMKETKDSDHEPEMIRNQLKTAGRASKRIVKHSRSKKNFKAWVQSKITKASDYLDTAADYLDSKEVNEEGLRAWFGKSSGTTKSGRKVKGWVQVGGKYDGKPCARQPGQNTTPKCTSSSKRASMSKKERDSARRRKVAKDPNQPQKSSAAAPTMVSTDPKKKMKEQYTTLPLRLEVPKSQNDFKQGLMFRESLKENSGMLFVFDRIAQQSFHMTETTIPLEVAFVRKDGIIESIKSLEPKDYDPVYSDGAIELAIEVNRGWFAENNVEEGDELVVEYIIEDPKDKYRSETGTIYDILSEVKDKKGKSSGSKDACYHKVKSRYSVWPSAYASGALVKCRKVGAANWGNKSEGLEIQNSDGKTIAGVVDIIGPDNLQPITNENGVWKGTKQVEEGLLVKAAQGVESGVRKFNKLDDRVNRAVARKTKKVGKKALKLVGKGVKKVAAATARGAAGAVGGALKGAAKGAYKGIKKGLSEEEIIEKHDTPSNVKKIAKELDKAVEMHKSQAKRLRKAGISEDVPRGPGGNPIRIKDRIKAAKGQIPHGYQLKKEEVELDEKCWAGYEKKGMKTMFGKRYPNCVKKKVSESVYNWREEVLNDIEKNISDDEGRDYVKKIEEGKSPAWQRKEGKSESGGLNAKGVASYRAANPGSKLKTAVTTKPSKLKKGSKSANRRKSFCARMKGMKKRLTSAKTARDPDSRINKSLRKWNC
tara:strand:+ start:37564 stop:39780 length:2217 start_codon:yes stop_codon:yes gene_type:complete